jgi:hypothetical protein
MTDKQLAILQLLKEGKSYSYIQAELNVYPSAVSVVRQMQKQEAATTATKPTTSAPMGRLSAIHYLMRVEKISRGDAAELIEAARDGGGIANKEREISYKNGKYIVKQL